MGLYYYIEIWEWCIYILQNKFSVIYEFSKTQKRILCYFINISFILIEKGLKTNKTLKNAEHNLFIYSKLPVIQCPYIQKFLSN
jgi:hypothetical protein